MSCSNIRDHLFGINGIINVAVQNNENIGWKVTYNIKERYNKGIGNVNKILALLNSVSFGYFYFEMALLLRQSMSINSMLCNIEVLYGLNKSKLETLE